MKKLILLLITLTTLTNVSYASFPVMQDIQTEIVDENIELPTYGSSQPIWGILSFIFAVVGGLLYFTPYPYFFYGWLLGILAIIFGANGFKNRPSGLAIAGFIIGILRVLIPIIISAWANHYINH